MIKVAEWIRVSDESQAAPEKFGIPAQKTVNKDTCKRFGLEVVKTFQVEDVSGKDIMLAAETHELVQLMQSGRIQGVVSREFSRLMRPDDFADYLLLSQFQKTKTLLYLPEGQIDFNDKMGRLMAGMQASISGYERSTIRERLFRGGEENRKSGGRFASTLPFGVGHSKEQGWYYNEDSQRVVEAYDMVLSGESLNYVARFLGMSAMGARYLVHNQIYKGWRVYERECGEVKAGKNGRQAKYRPLKKRSADRIIRVQVIDKPLICPEKWERACRVLDIKSESCRRNRKSPGIASYNGFLYCDACGRVMTPLKGSGKGYYVCIGRYRRSGCTQGYTRIAEMENQIDTLIGSDMTDPEFIQFLAQRLQSMQANDRRNLRIGQLEAEMKSIEKKRCRILDAFLEGDITKGEKAERLGKVSDQLRTLSEELGRLRGEMPPETSAEQLAGMFRVFARWTTLSLDDRRKLLSVSLPRMRVRDGQVVSVYRLLDSMETTISGYDKKCSKNSSLSAPAN